MSRSSASTSDAGIRDLSRFNRTALAGFAAAITILAAGMVLGIRSMTTAARAEEAQLRAKEQDSRVAEQLRWRGRQLITPERTYLTTRDPELMQQIEQGLSDYDAAVDSFVRSARIAGAPADDRSAITADVERSAREYQRLQTPFVSELAQHRDLAASSRRLADEILPVFRTLNEDLDRFVNRAEDAFTTAFDDAGQARRRSIDWIYVSLAILILAGIAIGWHFTRQLSRAYRKEQLSHEAAERAIAARDELMAIVAHDLRNPLAAITMRASIMQEDSASEITRKQAHSIENVTMRMDYLIKTMLDVATIEAGRLSIDPAPTDAADIVTEVLDMFGAVAEAKRVHLDCKRSSLHLGVRADKERVIQVLTNLVGNALKFTPPGGRVTISVEQQGEYARFSVADTGPGIASDDLPRVFDRFWRKGDVTQKGTGLGLFIAKNIIAEHGGEIWVESVPGHGSTFSFTLELTDPRHMDTADVEHGLQPNA
jgi:signal transduction histidine kinase